MTPYTVQKQRKRTQKSGNLIFENLEIHSFLKLKSKNKSSSNSLNINEVILLEKAQKEYKDKRRLNKPN